ncbi:uncharacterized protein LOC134787992 [Penaeus indicus]|uniref:uncharacterized protein LOC134787992 n=1 Tax=Penaeus indicus TaxID=29960 RepID=UPI00300C330E
MAEAERVKGSKSREKGYGVDDNGKHEDDDSDGDEDENDNADDKETENGAATRTKTKATTPLKSTRGNWGQNQRSRVPTNRDGEAGIKDSRRVQERHLALSSPVPRNEEKRSKKARLKRRQKGGTEEITRNILEENKVERKKKKKGRDERSKGRRSRRETCVGGGGPTPPSAASSKAADVAKGIADCVLDIWKESEMIDGLLMALEASKTLSKHVTWMRGRDLHILTVGLITYSADERFQDTF